MCSEMLAFQDIGRFFFGGIIFLSMFASSSDNEVKYNERFIKFILSTTQYLS